MCEVLELLRAEKFEVDTMVMGTTQDKEAYLKRTPSGEQRGGDRHPHKKSRGDREANLTPQNMD